MKNEYNIIDLTHTLTSDVPSWNGSCGFELAITKDYDQGGPEPVRFRNHALHLEAGIGTHMDAPLHCIPGGKDIAELAIDDLLCSCVVIDVSQKANEQFVLSVEDIRNFENEHNFRIHNQTVLLYTGWERYWNDPIKYRNNYRFPSISKEAASALLDREVTGIAIDTLSPDRPESGYPVHQLFLENGKFIIENLANAQKLPTFGSYIMAMPLKIKGATEAPVRLIGLVKKEQKDSLSRMETILNLKEDISKKEIKESWNLYHLLHGSKVLAVRILDQKKNELFIEFDNGQRLFVNTLEKFDISVT